MAKPVKMRTLFSAQEVIAALRFTAESPNALVPLWWEHSCLWKYKLASPHVCLAHHLLTVAWCLSGNSD